MLFPALLADPSPDMVGVNEGKSDGNATVGDVEGTMDGKSEGTDETEMDGPFVGAADGSFVGPFVGFHHQEIYIG